MWKHLVAQQINFLTWWIQMSLNSGRLFISCQITSVFEHCFLAASLLRRYCCSKLNTFYLYLHEAEHAHSFLVLSLWSFTLLYGHKANRNGNMNRKILFFYRLWMSHSFRVNIQTQIHSHINSIWLGPQGGSMRAHHPQTAHSSHLTTCVILTSINSLKPHNICLQLFHKDPVCC